MKHEIWEISTQNLKIFILTFFNTTTNFPKGYPNQNSFHSKECWTFKQCHIINIIPKKKFLFFFHVTTEKKEICLRKLPHTYTQSRLKKLKMRWGKEEVWKIFFVYFFSSLFAWVGRSFNSRNLTCETLRSFF